MCKRGPAAGRVLLLAGAGEKQPFILKCTLLLAKDKYSGMVRSFTDRVLGGVCGGIAARLGISAWWVRAAFMVLTLLSLGAFAVLYILLWWALPQESLMDARPRGLHILFVLLLFVLVTAAWLGRDMGWLQGPTGINLYWPVMCLLLALVFFLRQVRG